MRGLLIANLSRGIGIIEIGHGNGGFRRLCAHDTKSSQSDGGG